MTTTNEIESVKKELSDIATFVKDHVEPAQEERVRLREAILGLVSLTKDAERRQLLDTETSKRRVESGPYSGFDALDMAIVRSLHGVVSSYSGGAHVQDWGVRLKSAMDTVTAGLGEEFTARAQSARLWEDVHLETLVAPLFSRVAMPTNPFDIPVHVGTVDWYPGGENVATKSSSLATGRQTLSAYELVASVPWSLSLDEDSVIAMLPEVRHTLVRNAAEVVDDVLLNGDTSVTNGINSDGATIDSMTPGKAHWLLGFDGLLHLPLVDNPGQSNNLNGAVSAAAYNSALKLLGKYGVRGTETVFITDLNTFLSSLAIEEVETVDKLGSRATLLSGQLGMVYGHPLIVSEQMRLADADGKVTDAGNAADTGRILAVNRPSWRIGYRRNISIETERDIQKRQHVMIVSMRIAFGERSGERSTARHTALQYNVTGVA